MKVQEIVVTAGRTFNHPFESYSNLRPSVTVKATVEDGEDFAAATRELQAKAEELVEDHKRALLENLEALNELSMRQQELASLESGLIKTQTRLEQIRRQYPQLSTSNEGETETEPINADTELHDGDSTDAHSS